MMLNLSTAPAEDISEFFEAVAAGIAIFDVNENNALTYVSCNSTYRSMHQMDKRPDVGCLVHNFLPRYVVKHYRKQVIECLNQSTSVDDEMPIDLAGCSHWYRLRMVPVYAEDKTTIVRLFTTCIDITKQRVLEDELSIMNSRLEAIVNATYDAIVSIDNRQRIKTFNLAAEEVFCYEHDEVVGQPIEMLLPKRAREVHSSHVDEFGESPVNSRPMEARVEVSGLRSDGTEFPAEVAIAKINVHGNTEFTAIVRDISVQLRLQEELKQRATTDPLTHLYNRRYLQEVGENEIERCLRYTHPLSFLMLDIDDFKSINDTYGHGVGDTVLIELGKILKKRARKIDVPTRWGGEELCMLFPETDLVGAEKIAERLLHDIREMHTTIPELKDRVVTASIGISEYHESEEDFEPLISRADEAMYEAKNSGKDKICIK